MIYRVMRLPFTDVLNYLEDVNIKFRIIRNSRNVTDLETDELSLSVVSGLLRKGGMVYEEIAYETWWCIRPEEGSYAEVMKKFRERQSGPD